MVDPLCFLVWDHSVASLINDAGKTPAVAGNYGFFMANVEELTGCFRQRHHVSSQVSCCKYIAVTSGLARPRAGTWSRMQTSAAGIWVWDF